MTAFGSLGNFSAKKPNALAALTINSLFADLAKLCRYPMPRTKPNCWSIFSTAGSFSSSKRTSNSSSMGDAPAKSPFPIISCASSITCLKGMSAGFCPRKIPININGRVVKSIRFEGINIFLRANLIKGTFMFAASLF